MRVPPGSVRLHSLESQLHFSGQLGRQFGPAGRKQRMLHWSLVFLVIAIIAAILGFGGLAGAAAGIAKILFFVFLVIWLISFFLGRRAV
jgi:uncharacterized membrane protein YtjA (UPF0391 family)